MRLRSKALMVCLLLMITAICFASPPLVVVRGEPYVAEPEYWAVIIGIADYDIVGVNDTKTPDLYCADDDAVNLYKTLTRWPNWNKTDHIRLLLSPNPTQKHTGVPAYGVPTNANIHSALSWLNSSCKTNDVALIYYSGHGSQMVDAEPIKDEPALRSSIVDDEIGIGHDTKTTFYTTNIPVVDPDTGDITDDETKVTVKLDGVVQPATAFTLTGADGKIVFGVAPPASKNVSISYTTGHNDETICATDADINDDQFRKALRDIKGTIVVILDCCFSGGFAGRNVSPNVVNPKDSNFPQDIASDTFAERSVVLQAAWANETSKQVSSAVTYTGYGLFTNYILEGINTIVGTTRKADSPPKGNGDRHVSAEEAFNNVTDEIWWSGKYMQNPGMWDGVAGEAVLFVPLAACNIAGVTKTKFAMGEKVYVRGTNFPKKQKVDIYVIRNSDKSIVAGPVLNETDGSGNLPKEGVAVEVWRASESGHFDIWVDVNKNGKVDAGDAVTYISVGLAPITVPQFPINMGLPVFTSVTTCVYLLIKSKFSRVKLFSSRRRKD